MAPPNDYPEAHHPAASSKSSFAGSTVLALIPLSHIALALLGYVVYKIGRQYVWKPYRSTLNNINGPPKSKSHLLWGDLSIIIKGGPGEAFGNWNREFGKVLKYHGIFREPRLVISDPTAAQYILNHTEIFQKDDLTRRSLKAILGEGLLNVEGAEHRRQRKIMNPAFAPQLIRDHHLPIFMDKAYQLKDVLQNLLEAPTTPTTPTSTGGKEVEISRWLAKTTLDVIGAAGFGYDFDSLHDPHNELAVAFERMFSVGQKFSAVDIALGFLPFVQYLPTKRMKTQRQSLETSARIGRQLIEEKKAAVRSGEASLEKGKGLDLLSMVVRANMDPDLKDNQRMSDAEVIATIQTFVLAGAETSSTALTWALWELAQRPEVQDRLREECLAVGESEPSMSELDGLPYMDAVIHEVLRLRSPVPQTRRDSISDTAIPLGTPIRGKDGTMLDSVPAAKGTSCMISILGLNTDTEIWGPDAEEFKPDRWMNKEQNPFTASIPGIWGNMLTFIGGPRACIGFRFSLLEIKTILFVLMRSFEFGEAVDKELIVPKTAIVTRPIIKGREEQGPQMPLIVKALA